MVSPQQLMRVYGALMFSLSKCIRTPEVPRVHMGSFMDKPIEEIGALNAPLFKAEADDLLNDLRGLPRHSAVRKINEIVKRSRLAKVSYSALRAGASAPGLCVLAFESDSVLTLSSISCLSLRARRFRLFCRLPVYSLSRSTLF